MKVEYKANWEQLNSHNPSEMIKGVERMIFRNKRALGI